jgi:TRAP transporter 4TM/12TM fusion protein
MASKENYLKTVKLILSIFAVGMAMFHEYTAATVPLSGFTQTSIHLGLAIVIIGLADLIKRSNEKFGWRDVASIGVVLGAIIFNMRIILTNGEIPPSVTAFLSVSDFVLAIIAIVLVLEATRRTTGITMSIVALVFIGYIFAGPYIPGFLGHNGATLQRLLSIVYLTGQGIYGVALKISATEIFPLVLYGTLMFAFGGGDLLMDVSQKFFGRQRGGIAKIAVISSALFGTISGAGPANAVATGTFTIPMMKKSGYSSRFAAAVEACASIGGQIMPPVMGASAFLMADFLNVSYGTLIKVALPAAMLYFLAVYIAVDVEAQKLSLVGLNKEEILPIWPRIKQDWHLLLSIGTLVYLLVIAQYGPGAAGFWAMVVLLITQSIVSVIRKTPFDFSKFLEAIINGAKSASLIAVACACAGIILGVVDLSGLAIKMTSLMMLISKGNIAVMLIMTAIASMILGMALPTVACYIIVASLAVPPLIKLGLNPFAAHLFAFYFGLISNITPPVALTAYITAGIAGSKPIGTAITATRLGIAGFITPFVFAFQPGILLQGSNIGVIIYQIIDAVLVVLCVAIGLGGWWWKKPLNIIQRALLIIGSILIFIPIQILNYPAYGILLAVFIWMYINVKKSSVNKENGLAG